MQDNEIRGIVKGLVNELYDIKVAIARAHEEDSKLMYQVIKEIRELQDAIRRGY
jgi:hypothetical protein